MTTGLKSVIEQLERQKAAIEKALIALREIEEPAAAVKRAYKTRNMAGTPAPAKRKMSAEARKKIGDATKKRWALKRAGGAKATKSK